METGAPDDENAIMVRTISAIPVRPAGDTGRYQGKSGGEWTEKFDGAGREVQDGIHPASCCVPREVDDLAYWVRELKITRH
jgi:hypothetical protein